MTTAAIDHDPLAPVFPRWPLMRQKWRELLFLHWPIRPDDLRPLVPPELELDLFEGNAYVGLVPFTMTGIRPVGLPPVRGLSTFHETNVRTYVRRSGRDPGVWFFSLDAANRIAVAVARRFFHLPYYYARMFLARDAAAHPDRPAPLLYAGSRERLHPGPASYLVRAFPTGKVEPAWGGTLDHFLVERYLLYALANDRLYRGRVVHAPYPLQTAEVTTLDESLLAAAGICRPMCAPLAHFARGVDVNVYALDRLT